MQIRRVTKVVKGGKKLSFRAVVSGDGWEHGWLAGWLAGSSALQCSTAHWLPWLCCF